MKRIGVRKLRQEASAVLRDVERGDTFEVTDRGRAVALLTPLPKTSLLERLRAAGEIESASGSLGELPPPIVLRKGLSRPSVVLARLRADER